MNLDQSPTSKSHDQAAVERLLLARLLIPSKRPPTLASVKKQLSPFFEHRLTTAEWNGLFESALVSLAEASLATAKPLTLTEAGRKQALESIGMQQVPPRLTWKALKDAWLTPLALAAPVDDSRSRDRLKSTDGLKGYILKREYRLPFDKCPTLKESLDALIWKQLGIETNRPVTRDALLEEVVGRLLDPSGRLKKKRIQDQLPAKALGASQTKPDELRLAAIRRWIEQRGAFSAPGHDQASAGDGASAASKADDLAEFGERVQAAARASVSGRFGPNKVFIGQVWRQLEADPHVANMDLDAFKSRLIEANRVGLVSLSRADLVEAMNPEEVVASETRHLNAVFHFVTIPAE